MKLAKNHPCEHEYQHTNTKGDWLVHFADDIPKPCCEQCWKCWNIIPCRIHTSNPT